MYYKSTSSQASQSFSSSRFSGGRNRGTNRPAFNGRFHNSQGNNQRRGAHGPSKLGLHNPAIFIKKATFTEPISQTITHSSFEQFTDLAGPLRQLVANKGYMTPTPIQDQAIQPILDGKDVIGLASTGTGKTAAFLIPIINKIFRARNDRALIIVPTRELGQQIRDELFALTQFMKIYSALVIGGANINRQIRDIQRNPHIVIGTPGRIKDLIERRVLRLDDFSIFVLDEVDLMVDIGFIQDIKYFVSLLPSKRQSLFFSATLSPKISEILQHFVIDPVTISITKQAPSENVDQDVIKVTNPSKKIDQLHDLLIQDGFEKVLIFGRTKHGIEHLNKELTYRGFKTGAIHGNKTQAHRQRTLDSFKQDQIQILLATDVASRGLDINNVTYVINYDIPETYEDYIHRIGRTGRAGKPGKALTFIE